MPNLKGFKFLFIYYRSNDLEIGCLATTLLHNFLLSKEVGTRVKQIVRDNGGIVRLVQLLSKWRLILQVQRSGRTAKFITVVFDSLSLLVKGDPEAKVFTNSLILYLILTSQLPLRARF